jgi:hypothetical protein
MHRYDSSSFAVRVNQVQRVGIGHSPFPWDTQDNYYPVWFLIPDSIGTFSGDQIGTAYSNLSEQSIIRSRAFPSERIEISGGFIRFKGMANVNVEGRFKLESRSSDPCTMGCTSNEVIRPIAPSIK